MRLLAIVLFFTFFPFATPSFLSSSGGKLSERDAESTALSIEEAGPQVYSRTTIFVPLPLLQSMEQRPLGSASQKTCRRRDRRVPRQPSPQKLRLEPSFMKRGSGTTMRGRRSAQAGEPMMIEVMQSSSSILTSLGNMTTVCLVPVSDPSSQFCQTLLDGVVLGSGEVGNSASASSSSTSAATASGVATSTTTETVSTASSAPQSAIPTGGLASFSDAGATSITTSATSGSTSPSTASLSRSPSSLPATSSSISSDAVVGPTSSTVSVQAANANASPSTAPIPGQKLQVLPIGLGIVGGLAAITLAVVGYVLYERRQYRFQFRRRKREEEKSTGGGGLAEQGAAMGTYV